MILVCATCKKEIGLKEPMDDNRITHSICKICLQNQLKELSEMNIKKENEENEKL